MAVIYLLGMNPRAVFPIMAGSAALILPAAAVRFWKSGRFDRRIALGLTLGGIPGVLVATYIVKSLPLNDVLWLVVVVLLYTSAMLWRSAPPGDRMKITAIRAYQVDLPLHEGSYKWSGGNSVSVFDSTVVAVETDAGAHRLGRGLPARARLPAGVRPRRTRRDRRARPAAASASTRSRSAS